MKGLKPVNENDLWGVWWRGRFGAWWKGSQSAYDKKHDITALQMKKRCPYLKGVFVPVMWNAADHHRVL